MVRFDEKTGNLMEMSSKGDKLIFVSASKEEYDARPEDTLLYYEDLLSTDSLVQHNTFLKNALKDPTNPRKRKKCPKCKKNELVVYIRLKNDLINVCSKCENQWIEGITHSI